MSSSRRATVGTALMAAATLVHFQVLPSQWSTSSSAAQPVPPSVPPSAPPPPPQVPPIEADFIPRLRAKHYLNTSRDASAPHAPPLGIPSKLRLITIDVPQFPSTINAPCVVDITMHYPSVVSSSGTSKVKSSVQVGFAPKKDSSQAVVAQRLLRCGPHIDVLECSLAAVSVDDRAFLEELTLRLEGRHGASFEASVEKGGWFSKALFGNLYARKAKTVETVPHAVVADGAELAKVPGLLLHLSTKCKALNVPLFVLSDPRTSWHDKSINENASNFRAGTTAPPTLHDVGSFVRRRVKKDLIETSLHLQSGDAYNRGKAAGMRTAAALAAFQRERDEQRSRKREEQIREEARGAWRGKGRESLVKELIDRGVRCDGESVERERCEAIVAMLQAALSGEERRVQEVQRGPLSGPNDVPH